MDNKKREKEMTLARMIKLRKEYGNNIVVRPDSVSGSNVLRPSKRIFNSRNELYELVANVRS